MGSLIKLDIDRPIYTGDSRIFRVCSILRLRVISKTVKRSSSGNFHHIIEIEQTLTPLEIVCIQALMGSDFKRECFNLLRVKQLKGKSKLVQDNWNVLFDEKVTL